MFLGFIVDKVILFDFDCGVYCIGEFCCGVVVLVQQWLDIENIIEQDLVFFNMVVIDIVGVMFEFIKIYLFKIVNNC